MPDRTTAPPPADPPAAAWADQRYGVWHRRPGERTWTLIVSAGDKAAAEALLFKVVGTRRGGDWCVSRVDDPPARFKG